MSRLTEAEQPDAASRVLSKLRAEIETIGFRRADRREPWWSYADNLLDSGNGWTIVVLKLDELEITVAGDRIGYRRGCEIRRKLNALLAKLRAVPKRS